MWVSIDIAVQCCKVRKVLRMIHQHQHPCQYVVGTLVGIACIRSRLVAWAHGRVHVHTGHWCWHRALVVATVEPTWLGPAKFARGCATIAFKLMLSCLTMCWFVQPVVGHCRPCEGSRSLVHQPPHAEHVSWTPAAASVHVGMHMNGCEGRGGWYLHVGQSWGQHWHCRGQCVLWGVWVGGVCPDAFSMLVGSKGSKWREANRLWFISPHTSWCQAWIMFRVNSP